MNLSAPLPHLFGRFTAVMREHADLGVTLGRLRALCAALEQGLAEPELPQDALPNLLIARLRSDLSEHFALEEADEYFGTVAEEAPVLADHIDRLKAEHRQMLRMLEDLHDLSEDRGAWWRFPPPARSFLRLLEAHERAESALLRAMFHAGG